MRRAVCAIVLVVALVAAPAALADPTTYTSTQTIPAPPAANFAGSGGGDGWALAFSSDKVYNVFHHLLHLTFACHNQADAQKCYDPETITDGDGNAFATGGQPGLHFDSATGKLYVFADRTSDLTAGVVCIDTTIAASNPNPFCGFTPLTAAGDAPLGNGIDHDSQIGDPSLVGTHWYAFNYVGGVAHTGTQNALMCFDVKTDAACAGQPFSVTFGAGTVQSNGEPPAAPAAIGHRVIIPVQTTTGVSTDKLACFDDATQAGCSGSWPVTIGAGGTYVGAHGAPFPLMDASGTITGLCLPTGTDPCYGLDGATAPTPATMSTAVPGTNFWDGPAVVLGPRVYIPDGNGNGQPEEVLCFDYSTGDGCANFPKQFANLSLLYTVNPDPLRPSCLWVNADKGDSQIQDFDAYTGDTCAADIRVLGSRFVVAQPKCTPTTYNSLQIVSPDPSTYSGGTVAFADNDGNPIPGAAARPLDKTGTVDLTGLSLSTPTGLPQFVVALTGESGSPGNIVVTLKWTADYSADCLGPGITAASPSPPTQPSSGGSTSTPSSGGSTPTPAPPADIRPPTVGGIALPGHVLTCSPGTWSGAPTSYTYVWTRNGNPIAGATRATYTVQILDEAATLGCRVVAVNGAGDSAAAASATHLVGYASALKCPKPTGSLSGRTVGGFHLGGSRAAQRKINHRYNVTHNGFDNFCLFAGWGIRVGYPTKQLLASLSSATAARYAGHAVLALTANPFYALLGVRPGTTLQTATARLHLGQPFHVGLNFWYFAPTSNATGVLKVRNGVVQEVGLATLALTRTRPQQRAFIRSFS